MRFSLPAGWLRFARWANGTRIAAPIAPPPPTDEELLRALIAEKAKALAPSDYHAIEVRVDGKHMAVAEVEIARPDGSKQIQIVVAVFDQDSEHGVAYDLMQVLASVG